VKLVPTSVFLHTADFHNRLPPAAARQLAELKRRHEGALLLDAGDAVAAGNLWFRLRGEPILRRMADIGYDAMAMGNRESHPSRRFLERKLRDATFPILAANLRGHRAEVPGVIRPHLVFDTPAGRAAVIGLAPQMTRPDSAWARVTDYVFEDPVATAAERAAALRGEADLVVCLSHCGSDVDGKIAALPQVDLVLGGHGHRDLVTRAEGGALVVHPGHHGSHVAQTEIADRESARSALIPLESGQ
jgi:2',3'-cyclic-nucleotide 2'-phosphodiesterase (5'-nucleotidase family)